MILVLMAGLTVVIPLAVWPVAISARLKWRWLQWGVPLGLFVLPIVGVVAAFLLDGNWRIAKDWYRETPTQSAFTLTCVIGFVLTVLIASCFGLRRDRAAPPKPLARAWSTWRLVFLTAVGVTLSFALFWVQDSRVRDHEARTREQYGDVAAYLELQPVADEQNAAIVLRQAFDRIDERSKMPDWLMDEDDVWYVKVDDDAPEVAALLERHRDALELAMRASRLPECRFEPLRTNPWTSSDAVYQCELLTLLLARSARSEAGRSNVEAAKEYLAAMTLLSRVLMRDPSFAWRMKAIQLEAQRVATLERLIALHGNEFVDPSLPVHDDGFSYYDFTPPMIDWALTTHLISWCDEISVWDQKGVVLFPWLRNGLDTVGVGRPAEAAWGRVMLLEDDLHSFPPAMKALRKSTEEPMHSDALDRFDYFFWQRQKGYFTWMFADSARALPIITAGIDARRRLALLALAMTAYRNERGDYPGNLQALVPRYIERIPIDPFSGEPLRMQRAHGGVVLHCESSRWHSAFAKYDDENEDEEWLIDTLIEDKRVFCLGDAYHVKRQHIERQRREFQQDQ